MTQASEFFQERSNVHLALRKIVTRLESLEIPYVLVEGMALFYHGFRRFTEDVDLLVTPEGLRKLHENVIGLGYRPAFAGSKHLRDTEYGVKVEFLTTGDYPGDGKPKEIAFPDPIDVGEDHAGIMCARMSTLVELKLASGMTNPGRLRDLADVQDLITALQLGSEFADQLHPIVREKYLELWSASANPK